jgi:hypothetical protein
VDGQTGPSLPPPNSESSIISAVSPCLVCLRRVEYHTDCTYHFIDYSTSYEYGVRVPVHNLIPVRLLVFCGCARRSVKLGRNGRLARAPRSQIDHNSFEYRRLGLELFQTPGKKKRCLSFHHPSRKLSHRNGEKLSLSLLYYCRPGIDSI